MKKLYSLLVLSFFVFSFCGIASAQLLDENFDYTAGTNITDNGWTAHSGAGTNPITVNSGGLSYTGYVNSGIGNAALLDNTGEDDNITFTAQTSGTLYFSFLINVASIADGYFLHLKDASFGYAARVFIKNSSDTLQFGLSNSSTANFATTPTAFDTNTTYLCIVKYDIATSDCSLWVLSSGVPATEAAAGTPEVTATGGGISTVEGIALRQYSSSQNIIVDGIRVSTTWDFAAAPPSTPTIAVSPASLTNFTYTIGNGPSDVQSYTLNGANLTPASGNITVTGSTNYEVSSDSSTFSGTLDIAYTGGTLSDTTIYVRLKAGLSNGAYNSESISNSGGGATTQNVTVSGSVASLNLLFTENFDYSAGDTLLTHGWMLSGSNTTNPLIVSSHGLTLPNYLYNAGNSVAMTTSGEDVYNNFTSVGISSGNVYLSFLVNVSAAQTGDYFIALSPASAQYNYYDRIHIKSSGSGFVIGVSKSNEASGGAVYGSTELSLNKTYLVVSKYSFNPADTTDDAISIYVFGSNIPAMEPGTPKIGPYTFSGKNDVTDISTVTLRQGSSSAAPSLTIDGIHVDTTWNISTAMQVSIAEARKDDNHDLIPDHKVTGDTLMITGVITSPLLSSSSTEWFVQDATAGIQIFSYGALPATNFVMGDSVFVIGTVDQYRGLTEFAPLTLDSTNFGLIKHNAVTPAPVKLTLTEFNANPENYESMLVEIDTLSKASGTWPSASSNGYIDVRNASETDTVLMFLSSYTNIPGTTEPSYPINLVGIGNQYSSGSSVYNDGYEIMPRDTSDIKPTVLTGIEGNGGTRVYTFQLYQNYPNPFNPTTIIKFEVPKSEKVVLKVYDILGREVKTLYNAVAPQGITQVNFDASNLATGVYVYTIKTADAMISKKLMLLK